MQRKDYSTEMTTAGVAGLAGDPPVSKDAQRRYVKHNTFAGKDVFVVDETTFLRARNIKGRYERFAKYIEDGDTLEIVREYAKNNPTKSIIVQSERSGAMMYLKKGRYD